MLFQDFRRAYIDFMPIFGSSQRKFPLWGAGGCAFRSKRFMRFKWTQLVFTNSEPRQYSARRLPSNSFNISQYTLVKKNKILISISVIQYF
jgi:hypothetical protein